MNAYAITSVQSITPCLHVGDSCAILPTVKEKSLALASSIFRANLFGSCVVTHALEIDDFHVHLAAVLIKQHLLGFWMSLELDTFLCGLTVFPTLSVLLTKTRPTKRTYYERLLIKRSLTCLFKV